MPDLTGTPTTLGIGTYNVDADAPSGLGFNQAMGQIDALLQARVVKPSGIAIGETAVWNGSGWDRSSVTRLSIASIASGTPTGSKFVRDDGVLAVPGGSVSVGTTLPGSPNDGDRAILVDSTTTPTYAWMFQYDASITDANKWIFVGGSDVVKVGNGVTNTSATYANFSTDVAFTVPRAGLYEVIFSNAGHFQGGGQTENVGVAINAGTPTDSTDSLNPSLSVNFNGMPRIWLSPSLAASDVIRLRGKTSAGTQTVYVTMAIKPIRVA